MKINGFGSTEQYLIQFVRFLEKKKNVIKADRKRHQSVRDQYMFKVKNKNT